MSKNKKKTKKLILRKSLNYRTNEQTNTGEHRIHPPSETSRSKVTRVIFKTLFKLSDSY